MRTVTVLNKFQVVIPKEVREDLGLKAGTIMEVINYGTRIEFIPIQSIKNLKGLFKGLNTDIDRSDRHFGKEKKTKKPRRHSPA